MKNANAQSNQSSDADAKVTYVRVALDVPLYRAFDYRLPASIDSTIDIGSRVLVRFSGRKLVGVITATDITPEIESKRILPILEVLDDRALLSGTLMRLAQRMAAYYHQPIGQTVHTFLPSKLRKPEAVSRSITKHYCCDVAAITSLDKPLKSLKQQALLDWLMGFGFQQTQETTDNLHEFTWVSRVDCLEHHPGCGPSLSALVKKNLIIEASFEQGGISGTGTAAAKTLNTEQSNALSAIREAYGSFTPFLLDGVTGSGKTEVYLQVIEQVLAAGKKALVLVPEIGLTPQISQRFLDRLSATVGLLHSGRTDVTRSDTWLATQAGDIDVLIGTRSALFAPLDNIGVIIVDEEHDPAYKQQDGIRYHARDMAIWLAQLHECPVVLGSATPSFESLSNVERGRFTSLRLTQRAGEAKPPSIQIIDMRGLPTQTALSLSLIEAMKTSLENKHQVLLFLNRRGFAPTLFCNACGWVKDCPNCTANMVYHQRDHRLWCHHCGHQEAPPTQCESCNHDEITAMGYGTQRIEETVAAAFPDTPVLRIDRDTVKQRGALEKHIETIHSGEPVIMIGTQMLAKGHHFPNVSLVGILNSDHGFYSSDFRAMERMGQLIVQVAGRAGRGDIAGKMLLQTHQPDAPALQTLLKKGYSAFAKELLTERKISQLPPFSHHALLQAEAKDAKLAEQTLHNMATMWHQLHADKNIHFMGPIPAPMSKRAGMHRFEVLIQSDDRQQLKKALDDWMYNIDKLEIHHSVFWRLDIDPISHY